MNESRRPSFDAAALAGATLAASLVLFTKAGPYDWFACIIGITLLLIIVAFEYPRRRERMLESLALSAVAALAGLLVLAYILEAILAARHVELGKVCRELMLSSGVHGSECEDDSRITTGTQALLWLIITIGFFVTDLILQARHRSNEAKVVDGPAT